MNTKYFTINAVLLSTIIGYKVYFANIINNILKLMLDYKLHISIGVEPCELIIYGKGNYIFYDITILLLIIGVIINSYYLTKLFKKYGIKKLTIVGVNLILFIGLIIYYVIHSHVLSLTLGLYDSDLGPVSNIVFSPFGVEIFGKSVSNYSYCMDLGMYVMIIWLIITSVISLKNYIQNCMSVKTEN